MKKMIEIAKENPWWIFLPLLMGGSGTVAKFGIFDPFLKPLNTIIFQQKVQILMLDSLSYEDALEEAKYQMFKDQHWK